ncbi:MAG: nitroreductase family protein [Bacteroidales bacterium]|nr:nitroreductase family protein [Bacteroidales bacterium]
MDLFELIRYRRSIRKYEGRQVAREDLEHIIEAGLYAPNAGGGQRSMIVALRDPRLVEAVGRMNVGKLDRSRLSSNYVSAEQPSIIDDPTLKSGFYGAPTVCAIFAQANFLYSIPDAFCCAENMVLAATELGIGSCIVARGEETFNSDYGRQLMQEWGVPAGYVARCFVLLGYCKGDYPAPKPRRPGRYTVVEANSHS